MQDDPNRAALDREARRKGFHDYATMVAWYEKYRTQRTTNTLVQPLGRADVQAATQWHPAMLLDWVKRRVDQATR